MKLPLLFKNYLKNCRQYWLLIIKTASYVWSGCWIGVEILAHFVDAFEKLSRGNLWMLLGIVGGGLLIGLAHFLYKCTKMLSVSQKLSATDTLIEIRVGDMFDIDGAFVIGTSTTFDTDMSDSSASQSVLEQFRRKYYDNIDHLDYDIEKGLEDQGYTVIEDNRKREKQVLPNWHCR